MLKVAVKFTAIIDNIQLISLNRKHKRCFMYIGLIVGARPNFVKIAPIIREIKKRKDNISYTVIHTGQHYDKILSEAFLEVLGIEQPKINLGVGSASHGIQTGKIMIALEPVIKESNFKWVITVGDVNSTVAASLVSVKLGIKTAHVEAGLRSFDRSMPEEINRIATDCISDLLFVTEQSGLDNLEREGVDSEKVKFVGNVMIDTLIYLLPEARKLKTWENYKLIPNEYILVTLHRPNNVDNKEKLDELIGALIEISKSIQVIFPLHPRTEKRLHEFYLYEPLTSATGVTITKALDYLTFLSLVSSARAVFTDSGGIQEETTYLGIPCATLRSNTERPSTINTGTNELIQPERNAVLAAFNLLEKGRWKKGGIPPKWDGKAAERIINELEEAIF